MVKISSEHFGITRSGEAVNRWRLENDNGMCVSILDYGCTIQSMLVPDKRGVLTDVVLGYDDIEGYEAGNIFLGAFVGRYANRIENAAFTLNGKTYQLPPNTGKHYMHGIFSSKVFSASVKSAKGGKTGPEHAALTEEAYAEECGKTRLEHAAVAEEAYAEECGNTGPEHAAVAEEAYAEECGKTGPEHAAVAEEASTEGAHSEECGEFKAVHAAAEKAGDAKPYVDADTLVFRYLSPDGEDGFPGNLDVRVSCQLTENNELILQYDADTDADTVLNLSNHSYFNLNGAGQGTILKHRLKLAADTFTEVDGETIPTGRILPVEGTPMDFRTMRMIGGGNVGIDSFAHYCSTYNQLKLCRGYDHNFILNNGSGCLSKPMLFAEAVGDISGIRLKAYTTQPGVQLYTGNYIDEDASPCGKGGIRYLRHGAFCLETQHFPCSPNRPNFPSAVLRAGEHYCQKTIFSL